MHLTNEEWSEIFGHLRSKVREIGLQDIDRQIAGDFQTSENSKSDFFQYLSSLVTSLRNRSNTGYKKALEKLREHVKTKDGGEIQDIEVIVSERDSALYQTRIIRLESGDDYTPLIKEIEKLKKDLHNVGIANE